ncbi:MAG TPA: BON domain-containing protein [Acidobacteriaceae bacterium]|nr:BON domain-containing protein [Acidobacteriaceae bacterium]
MIELQKTPKGLKNLIAIAGALGLALALAGCKHTVDDATLNSNVQSKISADSTLTGQPIQVATANGVVTLNGTVDSDAARAAAANDVMQVAGIKMVNNSLVVDANAQPPVVAAAPVPTPAPAPTVKSKPSAAKSTPASGPYTQAPAPIVQNAPPPPPPLPPPPPPKPELKTFTLPAGTVLPIRTTEALSSGTSTQGSPFHGALAADVTDADGNLVLASGTAVTGQVITVQDAAHFKGSSLLSITLTSVSVKGDRLPVSTDPYSLEGKGRGKNTAEKVGGGAVVGAILGGIFGGGKGAAIGAAAGGGIGAGANAVTKGQEVSIPSESIVRFKLTNSLSVTR